MVTPAATVMLKAAVALLEAESVTCTVKLVVLADPVAYRLLHPPWKAKGRRQRRTARQRPCRISSGAAGGCNLSAGICRAHITVGRVAGVIVTPALISMESVALVPRPEVESVTLNVTLVCQWSPSGTGDYAGRRKRKTGWQHGATGHCPSVVGRDASAAGCCKRRRIIG